MGSGETEVISLAKQLGTEKVLIDDRLASEAARVLGLKPIPITYVLILAAGKGMINLEVGLEMLHQIISEGYHLNAEDYITVKTKMEKASK